LARERAHDKRILLSTIKDIGEQLEIIVFERQYLFRSEYRRYFPGPWDDIHARLGRASREIEAIEADDPRWEYLEGAGLSEVPTELCRPGNLEPLIFGGIGDVELFRS
jgi:hypothetical protein